MLFWVILAIVILVLYGIGTYQAKYGARDEIRKLRDDLKRRQG